ncbi:MAG: hypothetical protein D6778_06595 [Nitrospirae bacterium]|nr:MAG: hypothetical protein D6778_06595 [Nitrospirota bacterium]
MARKDWQEIVSSIKEENWQQAIDLVNTLIVNEPKEPTHFLKLGDFYLENRNREAAKRAYVKASELYREAGQPDKAILALKKALQIDEVDVDLHRRMLELMMHDVPVEEITPQDTEEVEEFNLEEFLSSELLPEVFRDEETLNVIRHQRVVKYEGGETIIKEGDTGRQVYLIVQGKVTVQTTVQDKRVKLAELSEGDIFGEMAFIAHRPRVASVVASTDGCRVLVLEPDVLDEIISKSPEVLKYLYDLYRSRAKGQ